MGRTTPEGAVLKAVCDYLTLRGILHWRQNNQPTYDRKRGVYRKPTGAGYVYGVPDVLAVLNGRTIGIECKSAVGVLSENQKQFKSALEGAGGVYIVARSVDDVAGALPPMPQHRLC